MKDTTKNQPVKPPFTKPQLERHEKLEVLTGGSFPGGS